MGMCTGPVCAMVWEGNNAVLTGRKCSVPPSLSTLPQAPSVEISASMSAVTSSTDPIPSSLPTTRSVSGSSQRSSALGRTTPLPGSTSESNSTVWELLSLTQSYDLHESQSPEATHTCLTT